MAKNTELNMADQNKKATPYEAAYVEWSMRLGQTQDQLKNWRLAALLSMLLTLFLAIILLIAVLSKRTYVYVAQMGPDSSIVNKVSLPQSFSPTQAQETYFLGQFINNIFSLPLDPVIARQNWFDAYAMVTGQGTTQLTVFAQTSDPFDNLGNLTKSIQISNISAVSDHSFQATFTVITYNSQGTVQDQSVYTGVFTMTQGPVPTTTAGLLKNPFGLEITYFSINREG